MKSSLIKDNNEFRNIYRQVTGTTKKLVDQKTAYMIISCTGKTVVSLHLQSEWPVNKKKVNVDQLYDIYQRLGDLCIESNELEQMKDRKITIDKILQSFTCDSIINRMGVEESLQEFTDSDGCINIVKFVDKVEKTRHELLEVLSQNESLSIRNEQESEDFADGGNTSGVNRELYQENIVTSLLKGEPKPLSEQARGFLVISPKLQVMTFTFVVTEPTLCEVVLSLAQNSDVPPGHFNHDLFLFVYNSSDEIIGITRFLLDNGRYSTGDIRVNNDDRIMVICLGTSIARRKSTRERLTLIEADGKLSKRFKVTLMNIFDNFDVDQNGLLSRSELNNYTVASGDDPLTDEEWCLYKENFDFRDNGMTLEGFLKMHQVEASDKNGHVITDLWHSLNCLGYDSELQSIYGCSYDISVYSQWNVVLESQLSFITIKDRNFTLKKLYDLGIEQNTCDLKPRLFQGEYFGLLIAKKQDELKGKRYQLIVEEERNVRWNFPHRMDEEIYLEDSDSELVLVSSYTVTDKDYSVKIKFVEI